MKKLSSLRQVSLGGHSALDPHLPIPNRTVKRSCADDSVFTHVKVGHRQAPQITLIPLNEGFFLAIYLLF